MMALNAKRSETWLWTPKLRSDNGSERRMKTNNCSERRNRETMVALNARTGEVTLNAKQKAIALDVEMKTRLWTPNGKSGFERQIGKWTMALNAKLKRTNGSERQNWKYGSERQNKTMALNAKLNWITMNVKLRMTTLNVVTRKARKLWTPNWKGNDGGKYAPVWHVAYALNPSEGS